MRWKCICAYDGTDFYGWQSQTGGNTIQDLIEAQLKRVFKKPVRIHGSGRTDSGVHAQGQTFHFDGAWKHSKEDLLTALTSKLPETVQISSLEKATDDFHARYSVVGKRYRYNLFLGYAPPTETRYCWSLGRRDLDIDLMRKAADGLLGKHDFSAFGVRTSAKENPVKDLRRLDVVIKGPRLKVTTEASGYLYKMVRSLVGALVEVGIGKLKPQDLKTILKSRKRTHKIPTGPARGLFLDRVFY